MDADNNMLHFGFAPSFTVLVKELSEAGRTTVEAGARPDIVPRV